LLEEKRRVNYNGSTRQSYSIYHRENSLVATVTYSNPLIAIQKYLFPSLPFVYVPASPGCHSVKFLDHGVKFPLPHSMTCGPTRSSPSSHHLLTFPSLCGGYVPAAAEAELAPARGRGGSKRREWSSCCAPCRVHRRGQGWPSRPAAAQSVIYAGEGRVAPAALGAPVVDGEERPRICLADSSSPPRPTPGSRRRRWESGKWPAQGGARREAA